MLASRLIADVSNAAVMKNDLLRATSQAAEKLEHWVATWENIEEAVSAGMVAISHLRRIKHKAKVTTSTVLNPELVTDIVFVTTSFKLAVYRRKNQYQLLMARNSKKHDDDSDKRSWPAQGNADGGDGGGNVIRGDDWNFWSSDDEGRETDEEEESTVKEEKARLAMNSTKKRGEAMENKDKKRRKETEQEQLVPEDREMTSLKAVKWFAFLYVVLCAILIIGFTVLAVYHREVTLSRHNDMGVNATQDQAQLVRQALSHLGDGLAAAGLDAKDVGRPIATELLVEMTTKRQALQDKVDDMHSYLTEFRGAVQDFTNQNQVTEVTTPHSLGSLCRQNETFTIRPVNDIYAGKDAVLSVLTPNQCANDASYNGLFANIIPSYIQYKDDVQTYRRTEARLACFYDSTMLLSVAVTHEHQPFENSMLPTGTQLGESVVDVSYSGMSSKKMTELGAAGLLLSILLIWVVLRCMVASSSTHPLLFPLIVGALIAAELTVAFFLAQYVYGEENRNEVLAETKGLMQSLGSLLLSTAMQKYNLTDELFNSLSSGLFAGRLLTTNLVSHDVKPASMQDMANKIDAITIARSRRGLYDGVAAGYAVASTFSYSTDWNYVLVTKLANMYEANVSLAVIFVAFVLSTAVTYVFLHYSPLSALRDFAVESHLLRYYVSPGNARIVYYVVVLLLSLAGIVLLCCFEISWLDRTLMDQAATTLGLLAPMLRSGILKDQCTSGCGMPDYTLTLYYQKTTDAEATYPVGTYIEDGSLPFPYPSAQQELDMYSGLQLTMSGVHTTLVNQPSFATPQVNSTNNISYPQYMLRNMLTTISINDTMGFVIERFPESYKNGTLSFCLLSFGVCLFGGIALVVITISERLYASFHERAKSGAVGKGITFRRAYLLFGALLLLPLAGFVGFFFVSNYLIKGELIAFAHRELSFMAHALGYRVGLVLLDSDLSEDDLIDFVVEAVHDASTSARQMGSVFCRARLLQEYPSRGSGTVKVFHVKDSKQVNLGSVDNRYIPVCGEVEADVLSSFGIGMLQYCYVEIPQKPVGTVEETPRLYLLVTTSVETMRNEPLRTLQWLNIKMLILLGGIVEVGMGITLFLFLRNTHQFDYPLIEEEEEDMMAGEESTQDAARLSLEEPLPQRFQKPFFLTHRHHYLWLLTVLLLSIILLYYTSSVSHFFSEIESLNQLNLPEETQYELLDSYLEDAVEYAYDYIVFPFPPNTIDRLTTLRSSLLGGKSDFTFLSEEGKEQFMDGLLTGYNTISSVGSVLRSSLGSASEGFASYCSYIASTYALTYIVRQNSFYQYLTDLWSKLGTEVTTISSLDYQTAINFAFQLTEFYDLAAKLFILDHMAVTSYAVFGYSTVEDWPFGNPDKIISNTLAAASDLTTQVNAKITALTTLAKSMSADGTNSLESRLNQISDVLAAAVAVNARTADIWNIQVFRCEEALGAQNESQETLAAKEEEAQITAIQYLQGNLTAAVQKEMHFRRTVQMMDYIESGKPLRQSQSALTWERWARFTEIKKMLWWCFVCTIVLFVVLVACLVTQWSWMQRIRSIRMWSSLQREEKNKEVGNITIAPLPSLENGEDKRRLLNMSAESYSRKMNDTKNEQGGLQGFPNGAQHKNGDKEEMIGVKRTGKGATMQGEYLTEPHSGKEEDSFFSLGSLGSHQTTTLDEASTSSLPRFSRFLPGTKRGMVCVAFFLLCSLVPICCSHWVMSMSYQTGMDYLTENSLIFALHPKMDALFVTMTGVLLESVLYYDGGLTTQQMVEYLESLQNTVEQLGVEFQWDAKGNSANVLDNFRNSFTQLYDTLMDELNTFLNTTSTVAIKDFFTPQSAYARATLGNLNSTNNYGVLSPQSCTTTGNDLYGFFIILYTSTIPMLTDSLPQENFSLLYQSFEDTCKSIGNVAMAELTLWHAIVAGAMEDGATVAEQYGNFENLVGPTGLASISSTTSPDGTSVVTAVEAYYHDLLTSYGTSAQQAYLFTNTTEAPSDPGGSVLGAYKAAGFVSSYLTSTTTEAKFSNIFGYNRNLTSKSATLQGKANLVELLNEFNTAQLAMYSALLTSTISTHPAFVNTYIWYTQLEITHPSATTYEQFLFLQSVLYWCCITSFWALIVATFLGMYILSLLE